MKITFNWFKKGSPIIAIEDCLTKQEAAQLLGLDFDSIFNMNSEQRLKVFSELFGEKKAAFVNSRFETDIILKSQKEGLTNWINSEKDVEPKWRKEITREISILNKPLSEGEMDSFIEKLTRLKLGVGVTLDETQKIMELSKRANEANEKMKIGGDPFEYDRAKKDFDDYVASLMPKE
jgi:hypothetical protein